MWAEDGFLPGLILGFGFVGQPYVGSSLSLSVGDHNISVDDELLLVFLTSCLGKDVL